MAKSYGGSVRSLLTVAARWCTPALYRRGLDVVCRGPRGAVRVLTAPGVTTVVAVESGEVIGFAQLFSDGELQAYLATMAVKQTRRGKGIGRSLVAEALRLAGGERIDLLSEEDAAGFYQSFPHFKKPGFRIYPFYDGSTSR